jgi:hypothetical protein
VRLFRSKFNFAFAVKESQGPGVPNTERERKPGTPVFQTQRERESQGPGVPNTEREKATTTTSLRIKALKQGFWFPPKRMPLFQEVGEQRYGWSS